MWNKKNILTTVSYTHLDVYKRQVGYILSEDPTYITTYQGARSLIRKIDRDDLLQALLKSYLGE